MAAGLRGSTSVPRGLSYPLLSSVTLSLRARPSPDVVTNKGVALSTGFEDLRAVSALWGGQDSPSASLSLDPAEIPAQDTSQTTVSYLTNQVESGQTQESQDLGKLSWSAAERVGTSAESMGRLLTQNKPALTAT